MKIKHLLSAAVAVFALNMVAMAQSNIAIVGDPTGTIRTDSYQWGAGFGFYVPSGVGTTINALGFWDQGGDGLAVSHEVDLYQYSGSGSSYNLLASVTVQAGTVDPLIDGYRWVSIPTLSLPDNGQDGDYYVILAGQGTDAWTDMNGQTIDSSIGTFSSGALIANNSGQTLGQTPVDLVGGSAGFGGANIAFIQAVPEPATCALVGGGMMMLMVLRRKM